MSIKAVLFDLDGTLLPMDNDEFTKEYFRLLAAKTALYGYEPKGLVKAVWAGTEDMIRNDGRETNETVFRRRFASIYGEEKLSDFTIFDEFYRLEFSGTRRACGYDPLAAETVRGLRERGLTVALATNPIFPREAIETRVRWAGLEPSDFAYITTYENSRFCKPNPDYFRAVAEEIGIHPSDCLMVGNDVSDDGAAKKAGMTVFFLTGCLINRENRPISDEPHGGFPELSEYIEQRSKKGITV